MVRQFSLLHRAGAGVLALFTTISIGRGFFENASRRDPNAQEKAFVGRLSGCTAFFVANTQRKALVISARHCLPNHDAVEWCRTGSVSALAGGFTNCKRIIASSANKDIFLFEGTKDYLQEGITTLRLASYVPAIGTSLYMVGHPADTERNQNATITMNCEVKTAEVNSPHLENHLRDRSIRHNCTTWGGNSGGPMLRYGSYDAVGLPFTYRKGDYTKYRKDDFLHYLYMALMADFVKDHRYTLEREGVVISESPIGTGAGSDSVVRREPVREPVREPIRRQVEVKLTPPEKGTYQGGGFTATVTPVVSGGYTNAIDVVIGGTTLKFTYNAKDGYENVTGGDTRKLIPYSATSFDYFGRDGKKIVFFKTTEPLKPTERRSPDPIIVKPGQLISAGQYTDKTKMITYVFYPVVENGKVSHVEMVAHGVVAFKPDGKGSFVHYNSTKTEFKIVPVNDRELTYIVDGKRWDMVLDRRQ